MPGRLLVAAEVAAEVIYRPLSRKVGAARVQRLIDRSCFFGRMNCYVLIGRFWPCICME